MSSEESKKLLTFAGMYPPETLMGILRKDKDFIQNLENCDLTHKSNDEEV